MSSVGQSLGMMELSISRWKRYVYRNKNAHTSNRDDFDKEELDYVGTLYNPEEQLYSIRINRLS